MIIDAHAHLVAPDSLYAFRARLLASSGWYRSSVNISNDSLRASANSNIHSMDAVGTDVQLISPRPFHQMHSAQPRSIVHWWTETCNDLIARTVEMYPARFAGLAALPTCDGADTVAALPELDRTVTELGFIGVVLNPDPSEGAGCPPPLGDKYWYPLYERLVELDVPALIHAAGCTNGRESYSNHFITEESIAILSLLQSAVFTDFPTLRLMVSHGGGSVPYQIGRWQAERLLPSLGGDPKAERFEVSLRKLWFDTVLHSPPSLDLLLKIVGPDRSLFGTENPGSGSSINPDTGRQFDDLRPIIESLTWLTPSHRKAIFESNALEVFPALAGRLALAEAKP